MNNLPRVYDRRTGKQQENRKRERDSSTIRSFTNRSPLSREHLFVEQFFLLISRRSVSRHSHKYYSFVLLDIAETITHRWNVTVSDKFAKFSSRYHPIEKVPLDPSVIVLLLPARWYSEARRKTIRPSGMKGSPWVTGEFVVQDWYSVIYDSSNLGYARYRDWKIYDVQLEWNICTSLILLFFFFWINEMYCIFYLETVCYSFKC